MRVRLNGSKTVVTLKHFRYCHQHRELLVAIQRDVENLELVITTSDGARAVVPAFRLNLDQEELRFLNPSEAA